MKQLSGYAVLILVLSSILVFDGCKRGDEDPFFSFRSRKARVTGDWAFESKESNITKYFSLPESNQAVVKFSLTGDKITIKVDSIQTSHDTSKTTSGILKEAYYRFDKNSKMEYRFHYELTWQKIVTDENTNWTTDDKIVTTIEERATGSWNFLSNVEANGVSKYKNKERLSFVYESYDEFITTVTTQKVTDEEGVVQSNFYGSTSLSHKNKYGNGERAQIWVLVELRNKKIVMDREIDNSVVTNDDGIGYSYQEKGDETCTLKPRE